MTYFLTEKFNVCEYASSVSKRIVHKEFRTSLAKSCGMYKPLINTAAPRLIIIAFKYQVNAFS